MIKKNKKKSVIDQIRQLWTHLNYKRKRQLFILGLFLVISSIAEVITIGTLLPFLGVLTAPEKVFNNEEVGPIIKFLNLSQPVDLLLPVTIIFIIATLFSGIVRIVVFWLQSHISMSIGTDFSVKVYQKTLYQSYSVHVERNSSEILAGSHKAKEIVNWFIQPILYICSSIFILIAVIGTLLLINPFVAMFSFVGFGLIYLLLVRVSNKKISENSNTIAIEQIKLNKAIQEGLGGIRDVIIDGTQSVYIKLFSGAMVSMQTAESSNQVYGVVPRFALEALGIILIACLAFALTINDWSVGGITNAIPVLGALALGTQRLLPVLQQIYYAYMKLNGYRDSTQDALDLLNQPTKLDSIRHESTPLIFKNLLELRNVSFKFSDKDSFVFQNLDLQIRKGQKIGIVGKTGSGKSTLVDIITGLLPPTNGEVIVDGNALDGNNIRAWQSNLSYVPQSIFLSDTSVTKNIAFGVTHSLIDIKRVEGAAERAQISQTIERWHSGYETQVGERGVRISGGQRQRIGIARALYKNSQIIILDEATSSLDYETESSVMETIESLGPDITLIIIAHRLSTLKKCDQIYELRNGNIYLIPNDNI